MNSFLTLIEDACKTSSMGLMWAIHAGMLAALFAGVVLLVDLGKERERIGWLRRRRDLQRTVGGGPGATAADLARDH